MVRFVNSDVHSVTNLSTSNSSSPCSPGTIVGGGFGSRRHGRRGWRGLEIPTGRSKPSYMCVSAEPRKGPATRKTKQKPCAFDHQGRSFRAQLCMTSRVHVALITVRCSEPGTAARWAKTSHSTTAIIVDPTARKHGPRFRLSLAQPD